MTWILPRQLHTSACALDMEGLSLDLNEQSQICAQSLFVRSKPSPSAIWLRKWRRDSWTQHLSGRILRPSLGQRFATEWTSSLVATHASHSVQPVSAEAKTTQGTCGPTSQTAFDFSDPAAASLKTSKDISAWGCPTLSKTWQEWVTERRGAYSQRLNAVRHTSGSGCSSWPSPVASEVRQGFQDCSRGMKGSQESLTTVVVKSWPTQNAADSLQGGTTQGSRKDPNLSIAVHGQAAPASSSTDGSRPGLSQEGRLWMTPKSGACGMTATTSGRPLERATQLTTQVHVVEKQWQTATVSTGAHKQKDGSMIDKLDQQVKSWATPDASDRRSENCRQVGLSNQTQGKLNPRWVCTLMNVPVHWVKP